MSSNLDQSFDSLQIACDHSNEAASAPEPFKPFPDEILPLIFHQLTAFQRCLILSVCRNWNQILRGGRGFWQIVHLPLRLSISTAISILQIFNLRSAFSLEEVVFEPIIDDIQDIDRIFEELRKFSSSVRVLGLPQLARLNRETRNLARNLLPNLCFFYSGNHKNLSPFISQMRAGLLEWRSPRGVDNLANQEGTVLNAVPALRYYATDSLNRVENEERIWFRELQYLQVHSTHSLEDMHSILTASKSSLRELDLCWWGVELNDSNVDLPMISLDNPRGTVLYLPWNASAARALSTFLESAGQVRVSGNLASLLCFEMKFVSQMQVHLYDEEERKMTRGPSMAPEELKEKTDVLLKMNPSLSTLTLVPSRRGSGSSFHLNYLLENLVTPLIFNSSSKNQQGSPSATLGENSILLPNLKLIQIDDPIEVNGSLLRGCLKSRRSISVKFKLNIWVGGRFVRESEWEEQSWMK